MMFEWVQRGLNIS